MKNLSYSSLTKGERNALYLLRDDPSIIIEEPGKGSVVAVWDRVDYLKEANSQLNDKLDLLLYYVFVSNSKLGGFCCFQRFRNGLYLNISKEEGLIVIRKGLDIEKINRSIQIKVVSRVNCFRATGGRPKPEAPK